MKIYLGGPLKSEVWRAYISHIDNEISSLGITTWSPFKDAGLISSEDKNDPAKIREILQQDLDAFVDCDAALFLLDDHHAGTALELGYVFCLNKFKERKIFLIGLVTHLDGRGHVDSMSRFCCEEGGILVCSVEELKTLLLDLKTRYT
jgi:hypothetical protein